MIKTRTSVFGVLAFALAVFSSSPEAEAKTTTTGGSSCTSPSLHSSFGEDPSQRGGFDGIRRKVMRNGAQTIQWAAVSFEPAFGSIYVFDCRARRLASLEFGKVEEMRLGPVIRGDPTLEVRYVPGVATGVTNWEQVALLQFREGAITTLWSHDITQDTSEPDYDYSGSFTWRYLDGGSTIIVTGSENETDGLTGPARHSSRKVSERYCLTARGDRFAGCSEPRAEAR
jgi:hypothetical protein